VLGVAVGGCVVNNPLDPGQTPATRAVRDLAPDVAVAVEAATVIGAARAAVASTATRHPQLSADLAGLLEAHRVHLAAVTDAVPEGVDTTPGSGTATYVVPEKTARARAGLVTVERSLHDQLTGLALRAESGPFARLLGAMAAAISQQLHGLAS
jgi:hypothetical protein